MLPVADMQDAQSHAANGRALLLPSSQDVSVRAAPVNVMARVAMELGASKAVQDYP